MFPPPINHQQIFESEVWNIFNALGLKYLVFPSPYSEGKNFRLIPPPNSDFADFYTTQKFIDWLSMSGLIKRGEGQPPKFNGIERPIWYVLTEEGQNAYEELSLLFDFENKFIQRFRPKP